MKQLLLSREGRFSVREQIAQQPPYRRRASLPPEETAYFTTRSRLNAPTTNTYIEIDEEGEDVYTRPQIRSSARRYDLAPYARRGEQRTEELSRPGKHPLFYIGICLVIMVVFLSAYTLIPPAFQKWQDERAYGYPRTFQTDANVGHGGAEHFIALNNHGTIEVVEIPNYPSPTNQSRLYIIVRLTNQGADLVPATLSFPDINGDGKPDLQVTVLDGSNPSVWVLFNNGTSFVPKL
jgi:hypothetical protein